MPPTVTGVLPGAVADSPLPPHELRATRATQNNDNDLLRKNDIEVAVQIGGRCVPATATTGARVSPAYAQTRAISTQSLSR